VGIDDGHYEQVKPARWDSPHIWNVRSARGPARGWSLDPVNQTLDC